MESIRTVLPNSLHRRGALEKSFRRLRRRSGWSGSRGPAGLAVISHYRRKVLAAYDFRGVPASGAKEVRAYPVASRAEAGELLLVSGRWNTEFIDELCAFPQGPHDDQVDALAGAFAHLASAARRTYNIVFPDLSGPSYWHIDGYSSW